MTEGSKPKIPAIDAIATPPGRVKRKNDGKLAIASLVPRGAKEAIARASEVGLVKYALDSYRENGGYSLRQCLDSADRHITARMSGEKYDPDASALVGHPVDHVDLAIWNLAAACECMRLYGEGVDDTWKGPMPLGPDRSIQISTIDADEVLVLLKDAKNKRVPNSSDSFQNGYQQGLAEARDIVNAQATRKKRETK